MVCTVCQDCERGKKAKEVRIRLAIKQIGNLVKGEFHDARRGVEVTPCDVANPKRVA